MANIVAIVGRPNVGKSTFFNRLTQKRQAIVEETSGVTRDRHYGQSDWNGKNFWVIDTGGYVKGSEDVFEEAIRQQVMLAIDEADVILFMLDVKTGIVGLDEDVAQILRKSHKKIFLVVNKVDNAYRVNDVAEFYALGFDGVFGISAINGSGTGELLDEVVDHLSEEAILMEEDIPRISVVGRPNVGKSSLVNTLIGQERNIVTPVAGTTRDSIHTRYNYFGFDLYLIDTAGIRKKKKVYENIEYYSVLRAIKSIEISDICILMLDAQQGLEIQDLNIIQLIRKNNKGLVLVVNKWDLVEKETNTHLQFRDIILDKLAPYNDIPIVFTSVENKQRIFKVLETCRMVYENKQRKIPTSVLNETLLPIIENTPPPAARGQYIKIKYITQLKTSIPSFAFFCNFPQLVKDPYKRFIENQLRKHFDFTGVPIRIFFRKK